MKLRHIALIGSCVVGLAPAAACLEQKSHAPPPPTVTDGSTTGSPQIGVGHGNNVADAGAGDAMGGYMENIPWSSSETSSTPVDTSMVANFTSGMDPNRQLANLTADERTSLCEDADAYIFTQVSEPDFAKAICYLDWGQWESNVKDCEIAVNDCLDSTNFYRDTCLLDPLKYGAEGCEATVGDFEDCLVEEAAINIAAVDYYDCNLLDTSTTRTAPQQLTATEVKCNKLFSDCPQL